MDQEGARQKLTGEARLEAYLDAIVGGLGHASRAASARAYCTGLLLPGERKSIEPMAARLDPAHVQAKHQSLHHVVAQAEWDDAALLAPRDRQFYAYEAWRRGMRLATRPLFKRRLKPAPLRPLAAQG